jgi:hypothetical protein
MRGISLRKRLLVSHVGLYSVEFIRWVFDVYFTSRARMLKCNRKVELVVIQKKMSAAGALSSILELAWANLESSLTRIRIEGE